jgi:integrase
MPKPLTKKVVDDSIAAGKKVELRDGRARGLVLRVSGPGIWEWSIRRMKDGKQRRFSLGGEWSLDEARALLALFDVQCKATYVDNPYVEDSSWERNLAIRKAAKLGVDIAPKARHVPAPEPPRSILWSEGVDLWLREIRRIRRDTTAEAYKGALTVNELKPFAKRLVCEITREQMAEAVIAIAARGKERQAETSAIAIRGLFKFLGSDGLRSKTSVAKDIMVGLEAPERSLDESDEGANHLRIPDTDDVARIMGWLASEASAPERDRLAGKLLVYTVQRRRAVALARQGDFEPAGDNGGLWKLPALHRKTASVRARRGIDPGAHVIPLPPSAWAVVKRATQLADGSEFLFPASRDRRVDQPSKTIHPSRLSHMFAEIAGNDCSPHDMRRAFATTFARTANLKPSDVKLILDHSEGVVSGDVTASHYMFVNGEHVKWPIMRGWTDFVDAAAERGTLERRDAITRQKCAELEDLSGSKP